MASGTERDGVDRTTMAFKIAGTYHGPGTYKGSLAQGTSGSFSHSDLGTQVYSSVYLRDDPQYLRGSRLHLRRLGLRMT